MSPDIRNVAAPVLLNVYWHLHAAELILEGTEPREANEACWKVYYARALPQFATNDSRPIGEAIPRAAYPAGAPHLSDPLSAAPDGGPHKHWTTRCLVAALVDDERLLGTDWDALARQYGRCARAQILGGYVRALQWQSRMMWLLATGAGDLLHCARVAYDRATGRPARKRRPADPGWLAAELDGALSAAWDALRNADDGTGRPFWPIAPAPARPRADGEMLREAEAMADLYTRLWSPAGTPASIGEALNQWHAAREGG